MFIFANLLAEPLNNFNTVCYTINEGLPQNSVTDVAIADDGQLIIATFLGLVAYDGNRFTNYIPNADIKFPDVEAYIVEVTQSGSIFIGTTTKGLFRYYQNNITHWDMNSGLKNNNITEIIKTDKTVYIENDSMLFSIDTTKPVNLMPIKLPQKIEGSEYKIFAVKNEIVLSVDNRIWVRKNDEWKPLTIKYKGQEISGDVYKLDHNTEVFLIENKGQLYSVKNGTATLFLKSFVPPKSIIINSMILDKYQNLWVATENNGLIRYTQNIKETLLATKDHRTASLLEDKDGVIWYGGSDGLCYLKENAIRNIGQQQGLIKENIRYLNVNTDDTVYALNQDTHKGFYSIKEDQVKFNGIDSLSFSGNEMIYALASNGEDIWISTEKRIAKITNGMADTLIELKKKSRILLFGEEALWFVDGDYLTRYKNKQFNKTFITENSEIYAMDFALNGDVLLAEKNNAYRYHNNKITKIDINLHYTACIHEFVKDELWICGEGLWLKKDGKSYFFDDKNGLTQGHVHDVINDEFGNIWVISNAGMFRLLRKDIDRLATDHQSQSHSKLFTRYTEKDGMKSSEFNGSAYAAIKTSDGRLWFASQKGIVVVDPLFNDLQQTISLKPFIEHLIINDIRIPKKDWLEIKPNPQTIHFDFSSVLLTGTRNISYRYKVDKYNETWQSGEAADFVNLKPDLYQLSVQAKLNNNPWSDTLLVKFRVLPAWYQTLLFRIFSFIVAVLLLFGLPLWRIQWLKKNANELKKIVAKQTKSLTEANAKLEKLAHKDELTGIANRRVFIKEISKLCADNSANIYLAVIDVDDFKAYNDYYGHIQGDECLIEIAQSIDAFSSENCLVARYGGEEFVMLINNSTQKEVTSTCHQLLDDISNKNLTHDKSTVHSIVSISVGLVTHHKHESVGEFIDRADAAMYEAKTSGKNRLVVDINSN